MKKKERAHPVETRLEERLAQLKSEFASGQKMMADLESQQSSLRATLLRISGAIQVIEEVLTKPEPAGGNGAEPAVDSIGSKQNVAS